MKFIPMLKADQATRMLYARIDESPDRSGMIMDYATTKPHYQAWSQEMTKLSDGKSLGNVRAMHGLSGAGRVVSMDFDDDAKAIDFAIEVVDDDEWTKVEKGVYTGVSPGGRYARQWQDGQFKRYTGVPAEISLVDIACMPRANFTMMKADGAEETIAFAEPTERARFDLLAAELEAVDGADDYRRVIAAQPEDMIKAMFPDGVPEWAAPQPATPQPDMIKGLFTVAQFAGIIDQLRCLACDVNWEAEYEGDGSALPGRLAMWIKDGASVLAAMATEESGEVVAELAAAVAAIPVLVTMDGAAVAAADMTKAAGLLEEMLKAGARNSAADMATIQAIHDQVTSLGATCDAGSLGDESMTKVGYLPELARFAGAAAILRDEMRKVGQERDMLKARVAELEALPAPGGPMLKVVGRGEDVATRATPGRDGERARIDAMPPGYDRALAEARFTMDFGR